MEMAFIVNPVCNVSYLEDAIDERLNKLKGILNCLIFALEFTEEDQKLDDSSTYHALWAMDGFIEEINCLRHVAMQNKKQNLC